ncbi:MAG: HEPN domain-containing protein [Oscillospiraceae bacterium]|nr:HEPN domain-containing protein [Oscillospiraceae bacterium]
MTDKVDYWFSIAEHDYKPMRNLFDSGNYDWCLYLCHLILEKLIKAVHSQKFPAVPVLKIHDLTRLCLKAEIPIDDRQEDLLEKFTGFQLAARYPEEKRDFYQVCTREFTLSALDEFEEIKEWLTSILNRKFST